MKKIVSIILSCLLIVSIASALTSCKKDKPTTLDFYNFEENDLNKLANKDVVLYGYFLLNPCFQKTAYIAEIPLRAINNDQSQYEDTTYQKIEMKENGVIAVSFKETPSYTSRPLKITGKLKKGNFKDAYYFTYDYIIADATCEEISSYEIPEKVSSYDTLASKGYIDTIYQGFLNLQLFANDYEGQKFPGFENGKEVLTELSELKTDEVKENFYEIFKELYEIYDTYGEAFQNSTIDYVKMSEEVTELYSKFDAFLKSYANITTATAKEKVEDFESKQSEVSTEN